MKEVEIEVFRVGGPASRGITAEHIAEVATHDCEAHPVPICFGHPKSDKPAAGVIKALRADGNRLLATVSNMATAAIEGIKKGEWLNRSFAFFDPTHEANPRPGKWSPRHLGLLGAAAPGIPGMTPLKQALAFSADDEDLLVDGDPADAVIYSGSPTPVHFIFSTPEEKPAMVDIATNPTPEQVAEAARTLAERETAFEARMRTQFEAANRQTVDGLVAAGKVLPAEADRLTLVFNALDSDELEFTADGKATKTFAATELATFLGGLPKRVPVDEGRKSPSNQFNADDKPTDYTEIDGRARALMKDRPGLTFEAAVREVSGETE